MAERGIMFEFAIVVLHCVLMLFLMGLIFTETSGPKKVSKWITPDDGDSTIFEMSLQNNTNKMKMWWSRFISGGYIVSSFSSWFLHSGGILAIPWTPVALFAVGLLWLFPALFSQNQFKESSTKLKNYILEKEAEFDALETQEHEERERMWDDLLLSFKETV